MFVIVTSCKLVSVHKLVLDAVPYINIEHPEKNFANLQVGAFLK